MKTEQLESMKRLAEGKPDKSTSVPMSGEEVFRALNDAFYGSPSMGVVAKYGSDRPITSPLKLIDGLEKLDYDKKSLSALRVYFKKLKELEDLRTAANSALISLRQENWDARKSNDPEMKQSPY